MRANIFYDRLKKGEVLLGLGTMYPAAGIIEGMCKGWDFVWIDGQHGQISYNSALAQMMAATGMGIETILRVPGHEPTVMAPLADLAPSAIMVPMVNNAQQAAAVASALRFAPLGVRSYGGRRAIDLDGRDYYSQRKLAIVAQIETLESVENLDAIIGTDGIDGLFFGPDDMRVGIGLPINTPVEENDRLRDAMARTGQAAKRAGKFAGCIAANPAAAKMATDMGYRMLIGGGDIAFLRTTAAEKLAALRKSLFGDAAGAPKAGSGIYGG